MDTVHVPGVQITVDDPAIFESLAKIAASAGKGMLMGGPGAMATGVAKEALDQAIEYALEAIKGKLDCRRILAAVAGKLQDKSSASGRAFARSGSAALMIGVKALGPIVGRTPTATTVFFRVVVLAEQHGASAGSLSIAVMPLKGLPFLNCCRNDYLFARTPDGGYEVKVPERNRTSAVSR